MKKDNKIYYLILFLCHSSVAAMPKQESNGEWNSELLLRSEQTSDLPGGRENLERSQLTLWMELTAPINDYFSVGLSVKGNLGTDDSADNFRNLDNSESNKINLDQLYADWNMLENGFIRFGRSYMPSQFSTMVWDKDIVTLGASYEHQWISELGNELTLSIGSRNIEHIFNQETTVNYFNLHHTIALDSLFFTYGGSTIQITNTETLVDGAFNIRRTNTDAALQAGFEIVTLNFSANFDLLNQSIRLGFEAGKNNAVANNNQMKRVNLMVGDNQIAGGFQFNYHYQDIEEDAAVAAFNDDEWWFATGTRGYRLSTSYGITEDSFVQLSYFNEKRAIHNTKRIFLEFHSFF